MIDLSQKFLHVAVWFVFGILPVFIIVYSDYKDKTGPMTKNFKIMLTVLLLTPVVFLVMPSVESAPWIIITVLIGIFGYVQTAVYMSGAFGMLVDHIRYGR